LGKLPASAEGEPKVDPTGQLDKRRESGICQKNTANEKGRNRHPAEGEFRNVWSDQKEIARRVGGLCEVVSGSQVGKG